MFKQFDLDYNKEALLKIYEKHADAEIIEMGALQFLNFKEVISYAPVIKLFEDFGDIFGATHPNSVSFTRLTRSGGPHIPIGHNGMIIFPLIGSLEVHFFNYQPPVVDGRPTFVGSALQDDKLKFLEVLDSKSGKVVIDKPTAYNGLVIHNHVKPTADETVFLAFKVPKHIEWESVEEVINNLGK
jgi:hypothetical protein